VLLAGAVWMLAVALFNIGVQLSAPRWVAGRSLAAFQASIAGGIAVGSWGWGHLTDLAGVETALLVSAGLMLLSPLLGIWLRMPPVGARNEDATELLADPEVRLSLTGRSGPLVVEIEYRVAQDSARAFHNVMQEVQLSRQRNGAYGWSIARDIGDPELWTERYHCPTWLDYLRQRNRATQSERALHQRAIDFHLGPDPIRVRRMLERPFGSVRWKEDTPDRAANEVLPVVATAAALLSHSNFGSSQQPSALKMRAALALLHKRAPWLEVDGEMHGDMALDPKALGQVFHFWTALPPGWSAVTPDGDLADARLVPVGRSAFTGIVCRNPCPAETRG
jgi:hypothetical protein